MRILWIVNLVLPQLFEKLGVQNSFSGTWLFEWSKKLNDSNDDFAIACVYGSKFKKISVDKTTFYLLPGNGKNMLFYTKKYERLWKQIVADFEPDIINIHGTEYSHGLSCMRTNPKEKYIISMQGILAEIKKVDYGGLKFKDIFLNRTFKENIKLNGLFENHLIHVKNSRFEKEMIQRATAIAYVNEFDYGFAFSINPGAKFYNVDYDMQTVFKNANKWTNAKCKKHTIFTNPGGTPLKGLHQLLKAVALLKNKYTDIKVLVPGMGNDGRLVVKNTYSKYIGKLIKKLDIGSNVVFLGYQTPEEMRNNMLSANVVVIPSAIEGTSLILRESMYLGCPCIASLRGGMKYYIENNVNGFGYNFDDFNKLAYYIDKVFSMSNKEISIISTNAIKKTAYYDTEKSFDSLCSMYSEVIGEKK